MTCELTELAAQGGDLHSGDHASAHTSLLTPPIRTQAERRLVTGDNTSGNELSVHEVCRCEELPPADVKHPCASDAESPIDRAAEDGFEGAADPAVGKPVRGRVLRHMRARVNTLAGLPEIRETQAGQPPMCPSKSNRHAPTHAVCTSQDGPDPCSSDKSLLQHSGCAAHRVVQFKVLSG